MAKVEAGMESMLEVYIFETNTLLEQLDEILLRTEEAGVFAEDAAVVGIGGRLIVFYSMLHCLKFIPGDGILKSQNKLLGGYKHGIIR